MEFCQCGRIISVQKPPIPRKKPGFYETTISKIAKRLHKLFPYDYFKVEASAWSRAAIANPRARKAEDVIYRIWSSQLSKRNPQTGFVEDSSLERAFKLMQELKISQEPREVTNFLLEEKKG